MLKKPDGKIADGTLELLKWLAMLSMLIDHANVLVLEPLGRMNLVWYQVGRLAAPLFALILAYNLARQPGRSESSRLPRIERVMRLTFVFGLISSPAIMWAFPGEPFVANILFNFLIAAMVIHLLVMAGEQPENRYRRGAILLAAVLVFLLLGGVPEYGYAATATTVLGWLMLCQQKLWARTVAGLALLAALASFYWMNASHAALLAVIPAVSAFFINIRLPWRTPRMFFYVFYPLHFVLLGLPGRFPGAGGWG